MKPLNTLVRVDVAIIGGGIAGLWLLARLRQRGYGVLLIESERLGTGQTISSQGIIHGGTKYALRGQVESRGRNSGAEQAFVHGNGCIDADAGNADMIEPTKQQRGQGSFGSGCGHVAAFVRLGFVVS